MPVARRAPIDQHNRRACICQSLCEFNGFSARLDQRGFASIWCDDRLLPAAWQQGGATRPGIALSVAVLATADQRELALAVQSACRLQTYLRARFGTAAPLAKRLRAATGNDDAPPLRAPLNSARNTVQADPKINEATPTSADNRHFLRENWHAGGLRFRDDLDFNRRRPRIGLLAVGFKLVVQIFKFACAWLLRWLQADAAWLLPARWSQPST